MVMGSKGGFRSRSIHWMLVVVLVLSSRWALADGLTILPQVVTGGGYISIITIVNANFKSAAIGTISFFNQDGTPRTIEFEGRAPATSFQVTVPSGGTVVLRTTPGGDTIVVGMAKLVSDFPLGGVLRFTFEGNQVGVLNARLSKNATLVINTSNGNDTGVAIANPGQGPINVRLTHVDKDGNDLETLDPPELNPLPSCGQIAKFVTQFGFTNITDQSDGTVKIQVIGDGDFSAFPLLLRNGILASTALVRGTSGKMSLIEFNQSYAGVWNNLTFLSQGGASLTLSVDLATRLAVINLSMTGNVFGSNAAGKQTTLYGAFSLAGFIATGTSPIFGDCTLTIMTNGNWTFAANSVPDPSINTFGMEGNASPDKITGSYTVGFPSGGSANGTLDLSIVTVLAP